MQQWVKLSTAMSRNHISDFFFHSALIWHVVVEHFLVRYLKNEGKEGRMDEIVYSGRVARRMF